ncbi:MAG: hypothetical protein V7642_2388 [Burkholderiales bacterium]|jgi:hypothetical protein
MSVEVGTQGEAGATKGIKKMIAVDEAGDRVDDVNTFAKLIKKAEEAAQAAL